MRAMFVLCAALIAQPAVALTQLEQSVSRILNEYSVRADVETLSNHQLSAIQLIAYGSGSFGKRRDAIQQELRRDENGCNLIDRLFGCGSRK
ncbi:MAG: hypothetical protein AAGD04_15450 [Pseudomonadota bacterium]